MLTEVADLSQSFGRTRTRSDGILPTMTRGSKMIQMSQGKNLRGVDALTCLFFPSSDYDLDNLSESQVVKLVGNSMAVPVLGVLSSSLLSLLR